MLNLEGFNSTIYSFNNKTWVSLTPKDTGFGRAGSGSFPKRAGGSDGF